MKPRISKRIAAAICAGAMLALSTAGVLTVSAAPAPEDAHTMAVQMTESMPLRQKLAQMIMLNIRYWSPDDSEENRVGQTVVNADMEALLKKYSFGGVIVFAQNVEGTEQTTRMTCQLQEAAAGSEFGIPLMIAADQEGGKIVRLGTGTQTCGNMALGATGNAQNAYDNADIIGEELDAVGINLDFAPVMDVNNNPKNPIINVRSFSSDPALVSEMGKAFISGLNAHNIISTSKHFPGHGDTDTDSHTGLPLVDRSYEELKARELIPFQAAIDAGTDSIMTAHIQFPQIETGTYTSTSTGEQVYLPATLSKTIMTDIVRGDMGFDGVIFTDGMQMGALQDHFDIFDASVLAINAGVDVLLEPVTTWSPEDVTVMEPYLDKLEAAVGDGTIPASRIDESCTRIIELKYKRGLFDEQNTDVEAKVAHALEVVGSKAHHDREMEITRQAMTLIKNDDDLLPLTLADGEHVPFFYPYNDGENSLVYSEAQLKEKGILPAGAELDFNCYTDKTAEDFKDQVAAAKVVVINGEISGEGNLDPAAEGVSGQRAKFLDDMIALAHSMGKKVIFLSMKLPYDVTRYSQADAILAAYNNNEMPALPGEYNGEMVSYGVNYPVAIMTLFGENNPTGKLPVDVYGVDASYHFTDEIVYPLGYGLTYASPEQAPEQAPESPAETTVTETTTARTTTARTTTAAAKSATTTASSQTASPATGDAFPAALLITVSAAAVAGALLSVGKRKD